MKNLLLTILLTLISSRLLVGQTIPEISLPSTSTAVTDDALSLRSNPAGLGVKRGPEIFLLSYSRNGGFERNGAFFTRLLGIGLGAEFVDEAPVRYNRYYLGTGFDLGMGIKFGFAYNWVKHLDLDGGWNAGLLFRPNEKWSLGLTAINLNTPRLYSPVPANGEAVINGSLNTVQGKIYPRYNIGVGLRPVEEKLTLSVDVSFLKDEFHDYGDSLDLTLRAEYEPFAGLYLNLEDKPQARYWGGGIKFALPDIGVQTYGIMNKSDGTMGSTYLVHLSSNPMRSFTIPEGQIYVQAEISGPIVEEENPWNPFAVKNPSLRRVVRAIELLQEDPGVGGLILRLGLLDCGYATVQELRAALSKFREAGKRLYIYADFCDNKEYYLASVADKIYMCPAGFLNLTGLSLQTVFVKGTLDKLGIVAEVEQIGEYKSAGDMLTREGMSQAHRKAESELLNSLYSDFTQTISQGRGISPDSLKTIIDRGPFTSSQAYTAGLVDSLLYLDELEDLIKNKAGRKNRLVEGKDYWRYGEYETSWGAPFLKHIAIIYVSGLIVSGDSGSDFLLGEMVGAETICQALKEAREDPLVKAIVMRIDSPGGDGMASDLIWREMKKTVSGEKRKPIIVSMGDVAASGGYYVACMADTIVADAGTITGSIGVVSGKFDFSRLYQKLGLNFEIIKQGEHSDFFTTTRSWTREEREQDRRIVEEFYADFINRVSQGRGMSEEQVKAVAEGRVWSGQQALEKGLVDEIGTMNDAIQMAMVSAGVQPGERAAFSFYSKKQWLNFDYWFNTYLENRVSPRTLKMARELNQLSEIYDGKILFIMPENIEVK
jgi:protease-4